MRERIGWSATIISVACGLILAAFQVQQVKMPPTLFVIIIVILSLMVIIAFAVLVLGLLEAFRSSEWGKRRIYQILGIPKTIGLGEQQIPIVLRLGATRYIGRSYVYFTKEKGTGAIVSSDLIAVAFDTEKANYTPGIREKGEILSLILKTTAKSQLKGWLTIGFTTEDNEIPYVHFPIAVG